MSLNRAIKIHRCYNSLIVAINQLLDSQNGIISSYEEAHLRVITELIYTILDPTFNPDALLSSENLITYKIALPLYEDLQTYNDRIPAAEPLATVSNIINYLAALPESTFSKKLLAAAKNTQAGIQAEIDSSATNVTENDAPLGHLSILPNEIQQYAFRFFSNDAARQFASVNKTSRSSLYRHIFSTNSNAAMKIYREELLSHWIVDPSYLINDMYVTGKIRELTRKNNLDVTSREHVLALTCLASLAIETMDSDDLNRCVSNLFSFHHVHPTLTTKSCLAFLAKKMHCVDLYETFATAAANELKTSIHEPAVLDLLLRFFSQRFVESNIGIRDISCNLDAYLPLFADKNHVRLRIIKDFMSQRFSSEYITRITKNISIIPAIAPFLFVHLSTLCLSSRNDKNTHTELLVLLLTLVPTFYKSNCIDKKVLEDFITSKMGDISIYFNNFTSAQIYKIRNNLPALYALYPEIPIGYWYVNLKKDSNDNDDNEDISSLEDSDLLCKIVALNHSRLNEFLLLAQHNAPPFTFNTVMDAILMLHEKSARTLRVPRSLVANLVRDMINSNAPCVAENLSKLIGLYIEDICHTHKNLHQDDARKSLDLIRQAPVEYLRDITRCPKALFVVATVNPSLRLECISLLENIINFNADPSRTNLSKENTRLTFLNALEFLIRLNPGKTNNYISHFNNIFSIGMIVARLADISEPLLDKQAILAHLDSESGINKVYELPYLISLETSLYKLVGLIPELMPRILKLIMSANIYHFVNHENYYLILFLIEQIDKPPHNENHKLTYEPFLLWLCTTVPEVIKNTGLPYAPHRFLEAGIFIIILKFTKLYPECRNRFRNHLVRLLNGSIEVQSAAAIGLPTYLAKNEGFLNTHLGDLLIQQPTLVENIFDILENLFIKFPDAHKDPVRMRYFDFLCQVDHYAYTNKCFAFLKKMIDEKNFANAVESIPTMFKYLNHLTAEVRLELCTYYLSLVNKGLMKPDTMILSDILYKFPRLVEQIVQAFDHCSVDSLAFVMLKRNAQVIRKQPLLSDQEQACVATLSTITPSLRRDVARLSASTGDYTLLYSSIAYTSTERLTAKRAVSDDESSAEFKKINQIIFEQTLIERDFIVKIMELLNTNFLGRLDLHEKPRIQQLFRDYCDATKSALFACIDTLLISFDRKQTPLNARIKLLISMSNWFNGTAHFTDYKYFHCLKQFVVHIVERNREATDLLFKMAPKTQINLIKLALSLHFDEILTKKPTPPVISEVTGLANKYGIPISHRSQSAIAQSAPQESALLRRP